MTRDYWMVFSKERGFSFLGWVLDVGMGGWVLRPGRAKARFTSEAEARGLALAAGGDATVERYREEAALVSADADYW